MLPLRPGPTSDDIAVRGWPAITARVAWELLAQGVRTRQDLLDDARDHVLFHLDPATNLAHAEDRAGVLTRAFVAHARRRRVEDPWPQDAEMPLSPRWRRALDRAHSPVSEGVLRHHYADGRPLHSLETVLGVDRVALDAARAGLREIIRGAAVADGLPLQDWPGERIDRMLARLATFTVSPCPPLPEVLGGGTPTHVRACARCARLVRLVQRGVLNREDLRAPPIARPTQRVRVMALHFHPDGRQERRRIARETKLRTFQSSDDLLLVDWSDPDAGRELVLLAAEVGAPHRDHLRGALIEVPGRWGTNGLLGPAVALGQLAVRSRSWGAVDGIGELPEPIPAPPSARPWWVAVVGVAAIAGLTSAAAFAPTPEPPGPLAEVAFTAGRGGAWASFDADDAACVIVVRDDGGLQILFDGADAAAKADLATGDGSYLLHARGTGLLLAAVPAPLHDLPTLVAVAADTPRPLHDLQTRLRGAWPGADVRVFEVP